jgi:hypothetical protein
MNSLMEEKRQTPRVELHFDVAFHDEDELHRCRTTNASQGGVFVESQHRPEVGSILPFKIEHPELPAALEIIGRVAHQKDDPPGFGVQITQIGHRSEAAFNAYCELIVKTFSP